MHVGVRPVRLCYLCGGLRLGDETKIAVARTGRYSWFSRSVFRELAEVSHSGALCPSKDSKTCGRVALPHHDAPIMRNIERDAAVQLRTGQEAKTNHAFVLRPAKRLITVR